MGTSFSYRLNEINVLHALDALIGGFDSWGGNITEIHDELKRQGNSNMASDYCIRQVLHYWNAVYHGQGQWEVKPRWRK